MPADDLPTEDFLSTLARLAAALEQSHIRDDAETSRDPHVRRRRIVELLGNGDTNRAEAEIRSLLDEQWKVPENIYLLGILFLLQGRLAEARTAIDRSLGQKPWLTEVPLWCGTLRSRLREAIDHDATWAWARYRLELEAFETYGMTLSSALSSQFEHDQVQLLQVGANDGVTTDPMRGWITKYGWSALLIEPMPEPFQALQAQYAGNPKVVTMNVAVADTDGIRAMWTHPGTRHAVSTFTPDRNILRHERQLRSVDVQCRTFPSLFAETGLDHVDVLQIDAEGYDFEILKLFDIDRMRPQVIHLEFYLLPTEERLELFEILRRNGFAWRMTGADLIAVDREVFTEQFGLIPVDPF